MKFGLFYEMQVPRPLDKEQWNDNDELRAVHETLEQIEYSIAANGALVSTKELVEWA